MANVRITGVTTNGCGGLKDIIVPSSIKIKGTQFAGSCQPIEGEDDTNIAIGTISSTSVRGVLSEGATCLHGEKFGASPK